MDTHPPEYLLVHPLPPAPKFVGREAELHELHRLHESGFRGVLALIGLGGAGKTAVAARFLDDLIRETTPQRPGALFLWSFYQEPDAGLFLQQAYRYFAGRSGEAIPAKGAGLLHLLRDSLVERGPCWLVLDGLERVQLQTSDDAYAFGKIEDPLLKNLLIQIAEGMGQTVALVTSRFPLTDLQPFAQGGYCHLEVGGLSLPAAQTLLRSRGVKGDDADLRRLVEDYGAHALTLDHLGGLIGQFLEGDPKRAPEVSDVTTAGAAKDRQALRLARLLMAYENHLPAAELTLLCRLCLLRRSVSQSRAQELFLCSPPVRAHTVRDVVDFLRRFRTPDLRLDQDLADDLAEAVRFTLEEALCTAPIAGPEVAFRSEMMNLTIKIIQQHETRPDEEFVKLAQLYDDPSLETPTDTRPLSGPDRKALRDVYRYYATIGESMALSPHEPAPLVLKAFHALGYGKLYRPRDMDPANAVNAVKNANRILHYLATKHFTLRRVRELCRVFQRKWSLAGALADLDEMGMRQALESLVERHLLLCEGDGAYSVHPAVKDHFHRLADAGEQNTWHDILREQLVNLVHRPGQRHPQDQATLDLAEEAIYHALEVGRTKEAQGMYTQVLGGLRHLAWKLGEMARGLRILRGFDPCPEPWDLGWYLRALGEYEQAFVSNPVPFFRADILLLQGRLPQVADMGDPIRTDIAAFLMGTTTMVPHAQLAATIPREQLLLYLGKHDSIRRGSDTDDFYREIGWESERARRLLFKADAARRRNNRDEAEAHLAAASVWILHSSSVEHLCLFHLIRARFARSQGQPAQAMITEGLQLARHCELGLYHIELLCEQAEMLLAAGDFPAAEQAAREALGRASAADCQFVWGSTLAGHLVGQALVAQGRPSEARDFLQGALNLRELIGDPRAQATRVLLASLPE